MAATVEQRAHHALPAHEVVLLVGTDRHRGLTAAEAADRLVRFGANTLPVAAGAGPLRRWVRQLEHPLVYVLLVAALLALLLGEVVDAAVIAAVVLLNAVVGYVQESKAEAALDALKAMLHTPARVVRDGVVRTVASDDLVPGDLVRLEAGDRVPADMRVVEEVELEVDESALTGESVPVAKDEVLLPAPTSVADRRNMVWSGTLVTRGRGTAVVVATGTATELGEIHRLVGTADVLATPLTRKLAEFSRLLTWVILGLAAGTFLVGVLRGEPVADMVTAAVALAVGAIPEGLPAAVTITLAIGVSRMARRRAVVRRLPAVETLGSTTVICTDKTGTLTENRMAVVEIWTPDGVYPVSGQGAGVDGDLLDASGEPADLDADAALGAGLRTAALCNDARLTVRGGAVEIVGEPTEAALLVVAAKAGLDPERLRAEMPRTGEVPFSSERRLMATAHGRDVLVKGSAEQVLARCTGELTADGTVRPLRLEHALEAAEERAHRGLRVLATAHGTGRDGPLDESRLDGLVLTGLHALLDPPREAAPGAVARCLEAGIEVKMITGDHAGTARAVADRVGILRGTGATLTGADLDALDDDGYPDAVAATQVFARVSPEQKLRLVRALQHQGHVVAMTGDGVNDAPALRQADIGIAMGHGGTEVAKEAADMVLTDDDFVTIEAAVEEGRGVFDNLTKFIVWTLPTNLAEGLVVLVAVLAGTVLPILPVQILWINMTTAVFLGLTLAFEPREPGTMQRAPRDPRRPLLTRALVERIFLVGALTVGGAWALFAYERATGATLAEARTVAVNVFVAVEIAYLLLCRTLGPPRGRTVLLTNRWLIGGVAVQVLLQAAFTYVPVMQSLFGTADVDAASWLRIVVVAVLAWLAVSVDKGLRRRRGGRPTAAIGT